VLPAAAPHLGQSVPCILSSCFPEIQRGVCLSVCFAWMVSLLCRGIVMLKEGLIRKGGDAGLISSQHDKARAAGDVARGQLH
jgi:hypothetical protein